MLNINTEQALILSALVNQAVTGLDDELFYTDLESGSDQYTADIIDALETELFLLEDIQLKLDDLLAREEVPA